MKAMEDRAMYRLKHGALMKLSAIFFSHGLAYDRCVELGHT